MMCLFEDKYLAISVVLLIFKWLQLFLGSEKSVERIKDLIGFSEKAVYTIQLATAAERLGFNSTFYTNDLWNEHEGEFYRENSEEIDNQELYSRAEEAGVKVEERELNLDELLSLLKENQIPIVLLDWHTVTREEHYFGHFAVITGYNENHVLIHNSDNADGEHQKIEKETFDRARRSKGTDQDVALISKE